uniref:Reverse transcriptase domain-containing protein n=1 Tax=Tanacetum cinerariifolium TaxID=118510 RepID=A0A6L2K3N3_TANCI|nr:reverse transcriptase domain-containing protein [Tanacetum cinerariifolium]
MADNRTMEELLQAPTEGYGEAIVIPEINADHFEIKTNLLQLVQANPYHGFERENPHTRINNFKRITSTLKFRDVPNDVIKLMMFPYSLEGAARVWYDKEPPNSILTWEDLAWERFKEMLRPCPHHGFTELTQIDTFYNGLNENDQDSLNAAAGGNLLSKTTREALHIIENKSKVCYSRNKPNVSRMNTAAKENASKTDDMIDKLADQISTLVDIVSKKVVTPAAVKAVEESCVTCSEPEVLKTLPKHNIPYPSRLNDQKLREKAMNQMEKFFQIFQDFHFDISFADALLLMPKFSSTIKSLLANKDKLFELAKIPLNENFSAMLLKKLPKKLGDPGKFLIPCDFPGMDVSDQSITRTKGVAKYVFVKVGKFHFPTDFVVVEFEADPCVPLILGRSFLRISRALIDVYREEITLRVNDEAVTYNLNQTTRYSSTYDDMSVNRIDIINIVREEYAQEMLGFSNNSLGGNPTSTFDPIISDSSPSLTPFEGSDFILEEIEAYLKDESISPEIDHADYLKQGEVIKAKSSIEEPPDLELKDLPSHLEYAYLEGVDKLPVIIAKDLKDYEKEALLKKGGITIVENENNEFIPTRSQMLEGLAGNEFYCFLNGFTGYFQIPINPPDPEKTTFTCLMEHLLIEECPLAFAMLLGHFKDCIDAFETLKKKLTEALILVVPDWNLPFELMCDASDFAIGVVLEQRKTKHFQPIHYATLKYLLSKQDAKPRLLWWVLLLQEFDIIIRDKKGTNNLATDHLSRLENPHKDVFENKEINENFSLETLVMSKYGDTHRLATTYHPQTSGQVEVSNRGLKRILERTVGENHASWSEKFEDALWDFRTAYKTPIRYTPYKLVYEKSCHLPIELEHKAYWALKHVNFDLKTAENTKKLHDSEIKNRIFNVGDRVLLFNSGLTIFSRKLKTRLSGPFTITKVFPYGTVELSQPEGPNFKVNGHRVKHYFRGDIPQSIVPDLQTFPMDK